VLQPSFKLKQKTRIGARVTKRYHAPLTPADRALARPDLSPEAAKSVASMRAVADPVLLLGEIRAAQVELGKRVDRRGPSQDQADPVTVDLKAFAASLKTAWKAGETRPTHHRPYRRRKPIPIRPSKLDAYKDQLSAWLEAAPALTAIDPPPAHHAEAGPLHREASSNGAAMGEGLARQPSPLSHPRGDLDSRSDRVRGCRGNP